MPYDNTNRGVLFRNEDRKNDKQPNYTGNINIDGQEFWLSAWVKEGKRGKFFSLSVKPKDAVQLENKPGQTQTPVSHGSSMDDDAIPFAPMRD